MHNYWQVGGQPFHTFIREFIEWLNATNDPVNIIHENVSYAHNYTATGSQSLFIIINPSARMTIVYTTSTKASVRQSHTQLPVEVLNFKFRSEGNQFSSYTDLQN